MRIIDWSSDVCSSDLSFPDNTAAVPEMLTLERRARAARRGIWADPFYAVRGPEDAGRLVDSFQIVEGRIVEAAEVRRRIYINFVQDWHEDLPVTIAPADRRALSEAAHDPAGAAARRIPLRGWIGDSNRPSLIDTTPAHTPHFDTDK